MSLSLNERTVRAAPSPAAIAGLLGALLGTALVSTARNHFFGVIGPADDLFADYLKFVLSFPGGEDVAPGKLFGLHDLVAGYQAQNPYRNATNLVGATCSHLHAPPLTALFCLLNVLVMRAIPPTVCLIIVMAALCSGWGAVVSRFGLSRRDRAWWWLAGLLSYPFVFMVTRGNVYAGITALLLIAAMLAADAKRAALPIALLLAAAVNLRPNAILFLPIVLVLRHGDWRRLLLLFAGAVAAIFATCLLAAHALYPGYTLSSFREGLRIYYAGYVVGNDGLAFGSSLYGALKLFVGYRVGLDGAALGVAGAVLTAALALGRRRALASGTLVFLGAAAYCLGSSVIADYHLLVFLAPAMLCARDLAEPRAGPADRIAFVGSLLMLAPLNYVFVEEVSLTVILHPIGLLCASVAVMAKAVRRRASTEQAAAMTTGCHV